MVKFLIKGKEEDIEKAKCLIEDVVNCRRIIYFVIKHFAKIDNSNSC